MSSRVQRIDGAGGRNVGAGDARRDVGAHRKRWPAASIQEGGVIGLGWRESVGLVLEAAYGDQAHRVSTFAPDSAGRD